ncbi:MAG: hypothetical protein Q8L76_11650, partial [Cypionkella sp.]|nr:hypothetical protein [Cypionkella sp.]
PGFITMNHPATVQALTERIGLDRPWVCANYNQGGYRMNPSSQMVRASFASGKTRNIAMSVFSSCKGLAQDALNDTLRAVDTGVVDAILFGSSNPKNIVANAEAIQQR